MPMLSERSKKILFSLVCVAVVALAATAGFASEGAKVPITLTRPPR